MVARCAGDTGDQVCGRIPGHDGDDNGADSQSHPRLHQQLRKPHPLRLPERQLSQGLPKDHLLQAANRNRDQQPAGTSDEDHESRQYRRYYLGERNERFSSGSRFE